MNANDDLTMATGPKTEAVHFSRPIALEGASNFRDLGGYTGHGGRPVRWRRLFRSDHLAGLTPQDQALLAEGERLHIVRVGDVLDGRYRVSAVGRARVDLVYLPLNQTQSLASGAIP